MDVVRIQSARFWGSKGIETLAVKLGNLRILVVDSDQELRNLTRDMLDTVGVAQVYTVGDSGRTFGELRDRQYDLIMLERQMNPVDGIDLTRMIRTAADSPDPLVPILMVTAAPSLQEVTEARDVGVSEFLIRPFSIDLLKSRISAIVNNPRAFIQVESYFGPDRRRVEKPFQGEDMRGRKR